MKATVSICFFFLCITVQSFGQELLNQFDQNGKKDGKWIVYLSEKTWKEVKDSSKAGFYRYTYYDHGVNIYPMGAGGGMNWKCEATPGNAQQKGRLKLLDGEYKWKDKKGRVRFIHILKNGEYVSYMEFYRSGNFAKQFAYLNHYKEQPHTYSISTYDKKGNPTNYFMRGGEQGWQFYLVQSEKPCHDCF